MYSWQIALLFAIAGLLLVSKLRSQNDTIAKRLRTLMIWVVPYVLITVGLCALFLQTALIATLFLVGAAVCFLIFLKRDIQ